MTLHNLEENRARKLAQVETWARENNDIRAMLLTSSLVSRQAPVDPFSDLDIELVLSDLQPYLADDSWLLRFGGIVAKVVENEEVFNGKHAMRMVLYDDYVKIDFKLYAVDKFREEVQAPELPEDWDVGYRVCVDKDGLTRGLQVSTYESVRIRKPTEAEFDRVFNDFWWDMTYVAKCLWRGDLFYTRFMTEDVMRSDYLLKIIEWHIAIDHDWQITTNKKGRLFKKYLPPGMWADIEATFAGSGTDDNWRALFAYADLGSNIGRRLAERLGYTYPEGLEQKIRTYLQWVRSLPAPEV